MGLLWILPSYSLARPPFLGHWGERETVRVDSENINQQENIAMGFSAFLPHPPSLPLRPSLTPPPRIVRKIAEEGRDSGNIRPQEYVVIGFLCILPSSSALLSFIYRKLYGRVTSHFSRRPFLLFSGIHLRKTDKGLWKAVKPGEN